jgi:queuine tRNA-ribosyltransferase
MKAGIRRHPQGIAAGRRRERMPLTFTETARDPGSEARAGVLANSRGRVLTPAFMPVGTQATVKTLRQSDLRALGAEIVLGNTYHLYLRPGHPLIKDMGGLHRFMSWERLILTDSGGFQVWSLAELNRLSAEVRFRSHLGSSICSHRAVHGVSAGSDIAMVLDQCLEYPAERADAEAAVDLTLHWAKRCRIAFDHIEPVAGADPSLFGIVQGGIHPDLRARCLAGLREIGFDGYALGGLSVGARR